MQISTKDLFSAPDFLAQGWAAIYPDKQPLNLEIGCGYGHFIAHIATQFPEQNFLGLDIVSKVLRKAERRLVQEKIVNARVCKLDANLALHELIPDRYLANIYILFPDPWPKERHQNRRIMRQDMLDLFVRKLQPGGALYFVSDDLPYVAQAKTLLDSCDALERQPFPDLEIKTKYEKKWEAMEKTITRLCYRKQGDSEAAAPWPTLAEETYQIPGWTPEISHHWFSNFDAFVHQEDQLYLKFAHAYQSQDQTQLLLKVIVAEPALMSHAFFLEIDATGHLTLPMTGYLPRLLHRDRVLKACIQALQTLAI